MSRVSPIILLVIVILAVIFFFYGLLHLLVRYFMKRPSFSTISQSNRNRESSGSHALQRQLQQLFLMHDSGLDQALIDALPIFYHKDIMGLKEPFDCAVCLCEFSDEDMLRLLPLCSHAFHLHCIDTWLLSNSTCPLCRSVISSGNNPMGNNNSLFNFDGSRERLNCFLVDPENEHSCNHKPEIMQENAGEVRVFSIRLGKFRSINEEGENGDHRIEQVEMISSCNLDGRRCYSMGTFQYIVGAEMQVATSMSNCSGGNEKLVNGKFGHGNFEANNTDREGKKLSARTRGESYSVSKIWLWSKKESSQSFSDTNVNATSLNFGTSTIEGTNLV